MMMPLPSPFDGNNPPPWVGLGPSDAHDGLWEEMKKGFNEIKALIMGQNARLDRLETDVAGLKSDVTLLKADVSLLKKER
jgi:hypothetical protein